MSYFAFFGSEHVKNSIYLFILFYCERLNLTNWNQTLQGHNQARKRWEQGNDNFSSNICVCYSTLRISLKHIANSNKSFSS